ncbi:MAG: DUF1653 domain-containing protein [Oscillospiraceae bacterium]|nr:DUF1653 domain-containing protein [Oscillospiraceae bacterium]
MSKWTDKAVIYHIYPIGFCGAPRVNDGGDTVSRINKVIDLIPHLCGLGVNAVYFGPVFESSEHGYDTSDYMKIDRRLGSNEDFALVSSKLHENGIRVVVDGVFNHVGRNFHAFRDVLQNGGNSRYVSWFKNLNFDGNSPMGDNFRYEGWEGHFNLVTLNLLNPEVKEHIFSAVRMWIEKFDIDGLRLDVAYCLDPGFIKELRRFCTGLKEDFWLMGEVIHGDYSRFANPEMLESVTNYECYKGIYSSHNDKNYFEIAHSFIRQFGNGGSGGIYNGIKTYNFVDNHDVNRLASMLKNENHIYNAYTILFTMPGCPSIYYGSEWGAKGEKRGGDDSPLRPCIETLDKTDNALTAHISKLAQIRRTLPVFENGAYHQMTLENKKYSYKRADGNEEVYILLNIEDFDTSFRFRANSDKLVDLLTGESFEVNGDADIPVKSCTGRILSRNSEFTDAVLGAAGYITPVKEEIPKEKTAPQTPQGGDAPSGTHDNTGGIKDVEKPEETAKEDPPVFDLEKSLQKLGASLAAARNAKGINIGYAAGISDIPAKSIIEMEKGNIESIEQLLRYTFALGIDVDFHSA